MAALLLLQTPELELHMARVWYTVETADGHQFPSHPECPGRVESVHRYLDDKLRKIAEAKQLRNYPLIAERDLLAVHTQQYLEELRAAVQVQEPTALRDPDDPDGCTYATPSTWEDALRAASSAVALVDVLLTRPPEVDAPTTRAAAAAEAATVAAFSICRPPGHHATPSEGMGFCMFNSAALAARHAQRKHGLERVMILDWDVHHGNGTQDIFYDDPSVLFVDLHRDGVWPESGTAAETGQGRGEGTTININLPSGSGHSAAVRAMEALVAPAARRFKPQLIIVSAGYDAHWRDPLEHLQFQSATYHALATAVRCLARELCGGRCLFVLEGGYHLEALAESVGETMLALLGRPPATPVLDTEALPGGEREPLEETERAIRQVARLHGLGGSSRENLQAMS